MSESLVILSSIQYYKNAKESLKEKDLLGFVSNINSAIVLSDNDEELLADATYLQAEGLFYLQQNKKALECISLAMRFNSGEKILRLKNYEGVIFGYLGELIKAEHLFNEVLTEITTDISFATEIYLNLSWLYLTISEEKNLEGAKKYLDKAKNNSSFLSDKLKRKIYQNYSVYYFYQKDYDNAIEVLNDAFNYADEKDLPELYNSLAEIHLALSDKDSQSAGIKEYLDKAEVIACEYDNKIEMANSFLTRSKLELLEGQVFTALDTLYLALEHFTEVEAYSYALECFLRINEIVSNYKAECMAAMKEKMDSKIKSNPLYKKIK